MSLGLAICLLALLWIQDELGYDRFHENLERIHKVYFQVNFQNTQQVTYNASQYPLAELMKSEIPEVENTVRFMTYPNIQLETDALKLSENRICFADPSFFDIFTFPFIYGDPASALDVPQSIVITERTAQQYFSNKDPVGKVIKYMNRSDLIVTGVIKDIPRQSSLQFDAIASFKRVLPPNEIQEDWGGNPFHTFALIQPKSNLKSVEEKTTNLVKARRAGTTDETIYLTHPFKKYHLYMPDGSGLNKTLLILALTAGFILLIACINFVNLGTARASTRSLEVGLRKTVGATRHDMVRQFMGESFLLILSATALALTITLVTLPAYCQTIQRTLPLTNLFRKEILLGLTGILTLTVLLTGIYPSWIMSALQPVTALKSIKSPKSSQALYRRLLVILQFTLSTLLIIAMLTLGKQMTFIQQKDLGYEPDNLLEIYLPGSLKSQYETIKISFFNLPILRM
jgi:cell division protein FtsX